MKQQCQGCLLRAQGAGHRCVVWGGFQGSSFGVHGAGCLGRSTVWCWLFQGFGIRVYGEGLRSSGLGGTLLLVLAKTAGFPPSRLSTDCFHLKIWHICTESRCSFRFVIVPNRSQIRKIAFFFIPSLEKKLFISMLTQPFCSTAQCNADANLLVRARRQAAQWIHQQQEQERKQQQRQHRAPFALEAHAA